MRKLIAIESLLLIILAMAGISLVVVDTFNPNILNSDQTNNATLAILSSVTLFLFIQLFRLRKLDDQTTQLDRLNSQLLKLDIEEISQNLKNNHYGGIIAVHQRLPEDKLNERIASSNNIFLLNTWIPNMTNYIESIENALNRNANVQILLLYPYSNIAELRNESLRTSKSPLLDQNVRQGVEHCMETLCYVLNRVPKEKHRFLKVRFFNSLPSVSVYKTDDKMLVGVFFHGRLAIRSAQFDIDGDNTLLGKHVVSELSILWDIGQEIQDICDWRTQLDLLADKF
jgi:hypothetical protein